MSRRISLLVAATTSAVILAFLIPLGLLVRNMASDRATADADAEARNVAILVSSLHENAGLQDAVATLDARSAVRTSVVLAEGGHFGSGSATAASPDVRRARKGAAFTVRTATGRRIVIPVLTSNGTDVVVTDVTNAQLRAGVARAWFVLGILGALMLLAAMAIAEQLGRRISTPLRRVAEIADQLREGDLSARAQVEGPSETRALAVALNRLGERIEELLVAELPSAIFRTGCAPRSRRCGSTSRASPTRRPPSGWAFTSPTSSAASTRSSRTLGVRCGTT